MTAPDRDEEFEAFLKRHTLLNTLVDKLEPPARLDEKILNQAREAVHARREPHRVARWARPMALAATILLCLSVVVNVTLNTHRSADRSVANLERSSRATVPTNADKSLAAAAPEAPPYSAAEEKKSAANLRSNAVAARTDAPASNSDTRANTASGALAQRAPPAGAPTPDARFQSLASSSDAESTSRALGQAQRAPAEPAFGTAAPAAAPALRADARRPALAKSKAGATHPQDPKVWLQQIEALRSQGKQAQADAEMQRFRAAFPTYRLPAASADRP